MKLKATAAVLSAAALFAACSDEVVNVNDEAKEKATIAFKVVDDYTGEAIEGATVYSVLDDKTKEADELGMVSWKKNSIGNYVYYISAEGYKTIQVDAAAVEMGQGNVARVPNVFQEVRMVKGGVKASGTVLYTDEKGNKNAAAKVTVFANCGADFVPSEISVVTDETGAYAFDDLPAGARCGISVGQEEIKEHLYRMGDGEGKTVGSGNRSGDIVNLASINLTRVTSVLELISTNFEKIDTATSLKISFSAKLAKDSIANKWTVSNYAGKVLTTVSLDEDGKTIVIKPYSGKWDKTESYSVKGTAYSTDGAIYPFGATSFKVGASAAKVPGQVTDLKAVESENYTSAVELTWKAPEGTVTGYNVYYKTNDKDMKDWQVYYGNYDPTGYYGPDYGSSSEPVVIRLNYLSGDFTAVEFIVLPATAAGEADISKAKSVKYTIPAEEVIR